MDKYKKQIDKTPNSKINFLKDNAHYLKRGFNLGSDEEIIDSIKYVFYDYTEDLLKNVPEASSMPKRQILELFALNESSSSASKAYSRLWPTYITYDFETRLSEDFEHIPNLCIVKNTSKR